MTLLLTLPHSEARSVSASRPVRHPARSLRNEDELEAVEHLMASLGGGERLDRAGVMVQEHLATGGKRLRARLALATVAALGCSREIARSWAAAVELLHNATLIHDDIQDGDVVRRGQATTWVRHGVPQAINAGDLLLMLPFLAVGADHHLDGALRGTLSTCLARHAAQTVRGQSLEMDLLTLSLVQPGPYLRAVAGKTGGLFALPVEGSALIAGLSPEEAEAIGEAFSQLGVLFQLQDDVLDLWGDKGRGRKGVDLEEGKVSALVVAHLERCPEDTESLLDLLRTPRERCPRARVDEFIARFEQSGARDDVMAQIRHLREAVISAPALARHPGLRELAGELVMVACAPLSHLPGAPARGF